MNKWRSYLNRWTPGKGRKEVKKGLTQASLSLEPPDVSCRVDPSALRNSISLDASLVSSSDIIEEVLAPRTIDPPPLEKHESPCSEAEEQSTPCISPTPPQFHPSGMSVRGSSEPERTENSAPTTDLLDYLPMSPIPSSCSSFPPFSTDSLQTPLAIPPPSTDKPRIITDGYIPLDTCSSGKRIASFKLEQEQMFNHHHHHHHHQYHPHINFFPTDHEEIYPTRPSLPTKDLYFLESVPPIPRYSHLSERLPCPPLSNRRKIHNSHSMACEGDPYLPQPTSPWAPDKRDLRNLNHNSIHFFSDRCHRNKMTSHDFGVYVECDNNNNNNNDFNQQDSIDDRGYYNDAISSLQRHKQKRYHGSVSPSLLDRDSKELLRRPVPPPRSAFNRHHSYANEPRTNSFRRQQNQFESSKPFMESYNSLRRQKEHEDVEREIREPPPFARKVQKKIVPRTHRAPCSDDADSLDGSSSYSNEETGSISDFMPSSDEPFNLRFAPRIKTVSRSVYEAKPRPNVEIKYLQLSLQQTPEDLSWTASNNKVEPEHGISNYKEIDWLKTKALQKTKQQLTLEQGSKEMNI